MEGPFAGFGCPLMMPTLRPWRQQVTLLLIQGQTYMHVCSIACSTLGRLQRRLLRGMLIPWTIPIPTVHRAVLSFALRMNCAWHGMAWHGWESGRRTDGFSSHFHSARQPKRQPWQATYWRRCCATQSSPDASKLLGPVTSGASCFCQTDPPAAGTPAPGYSTTRLSQWFVLQPNHFGCSCLCSFGGSRQAFWFDWQVR